MRNEEFRKTMTRFDSYTINETGPLLSAEASVHFERDADGYGVICKIGGKRFTRNFYPGEGNKTFRLDISLFILKWQVSHKSKSTSSARFTILTTKTVNGHEYSCARKFATT